MARFYGRSVTFAVAITLLGATWCGAFQLLAPTEGQAVRERVKIQTSVEAVPEGGFISVLIGEPGAEKFAVAISRDSAVVTSNSLMFFWNSKAPYYDSSDPMKPLYLKDGRYPVTIQIHDAKGKTTESALVNVEIKNRVPRTNPAPGITLANRLAFGQINEYRVHCDVSVFEVVNRIGLPIFGGMGLSGDMLIVQSVEDARSDGQYLIRLRTDEKTYVSSYGVKSYLYAGQELKPQLYRLVTKYGKVITANMFAKQAKYRIMDLLPVLPSGAQKEGDSWPDSMTLQIDGLTPYIKLKGNASLDSFEWQDGRECVKITSLLTGDIPINLANGKIRGNGPVNAEVTTYFAYKSGMMLQRDIRFTFDATIMPGAGDDPNAGMGSPSPGLPGVGSPYPDEMDAPTMPTPTVRRNPGAGSDGTAGTAETGAKKGMVQLDVVVRLEK